MSEVFLSVVIPAHNEEHRIEDCLSELLFYLWNYTHYKFEVIVVVNGSTDKTFSLAKKWEIEWPQIKVINMKEKGKGIAVAVGMQTAVGKYRYMADVDLATPPREINRFMQTIAGHFDMVIGSRHIESLSPGRLVLHKLYRLITLPVVHEYRDTQCGFKMFTARAAEYIFPRLSTHGLAFDIEVLKIAGLLHLTVCELPVEWEDKGGSVIRPIRDGIKMIIDLIPIMRIRKYSRLLPYAIPPETRQA